MATEVGALLMERFHTRESTYSFPIFITGKKVHFFVNKNVTLQWQIF